MAFAYEKRLFFAIHARMPRHHVPASESLGLSLRSEPGGNMRRLLVFSSFFWWTLSLCASQPDAKSLLRDAAAHYRNAQSFRIEFETKITSSSPFSNGWSKQIYIVATIDHKFHWEQKGSGLSGIRISDGESDWFYQPSIRE